MEQASQPWRDELARIVEEAVGRQQAEQAEQTRELRREIAELRLAVNRASEQTLGAIRDVEVRDRHDIFAAGERHAVVESARFAAEHMPTVPTFPTPHHTLRYALSLAPAEGLALEFGVFEGATLKIIAAAREGRDVYGFDSFEGLPEDWRSGFPKGAFGVDGLPAVPGAELIKGWFSDTLPMFLAEQPGPVSFLHVDCDLYSSTVTVLDQVGPRLQPGSIVQFDEFFNFPAWREHEFRAWQEYVARTGITYEYAGYTLIDEQVIVRITGTG